MTNKVQNSVTTLPKKYEGCVLALKTRSKNTLAHQYVVGTVLEIGDDDEGNQVLTLIEALVNGKLYDDENADRYTANGSRLGINGFKIRTKDITDLDIVGFNDEVCKKKESSQEGKDVWNLVPASGVVRPTPMKPSVSISSMSNIAINENKLNNTSSANKESKQCDRLVFATPQKDLEAKNETKADKKFEAVASNSKQVNADGHAILNRLVASASNLKISEPLTSKNSNVLMQLLSNGNMISKRVNDSGDSSRNRPPQPQTTNTIFSVPSSTERIKSKQPRKQIESDQKCATARHPRETDERKDKIAPSPIKSKAQIKGTGSKGHKGKEREATFEMTTEEIQSSDFDFEANLKSFEKLPVRCSENAKVVPTSKQVVNDNKAEFEGRRMVEKKATMSLNDFKNSVTYSSTSRNTVLSQLSNSQAPGSQGKSSTSKTAPSRHDLNDDKRVLEFEASDTTLRWNRVVPSIKLDQSILARSSQAFVSDTGVLVPTVPITTRNVILNDADAFGLTHYRTIEAMGRSVAEIVLNHLGEAYRLSPERPALERPRVITITGPHWQGAVGICASRILETMGVNTLILAPKLEMNICAVEEELYNLCKSNFASSGTKIDYVCRKVNDRHCENFFESTSISMTGTDVIIWAADDPNFDVKFDESNEEHKLLINIWEKIYMQISRGDTKFIPQVVSIDPPCDSRLITVIQKCAKKFLSGKVISKLKWTWVLVCPCFPLNYDKLLLDVNDDNVIKFYIVNVGVPTEIMKFRGLEYQSPFGNKLILRLFPKK